MNRIRLGGKGRRPDDVLDLHELGLEFAELSVAHPERFSRKIEDFQRIREQTGLYFLCHAPREGDPNDREALEHSYFPKLLQVLEIMPELDMTVMTVHLWIDSRFVQREVLDYKRQFLQRLTQQAEESGISVCLENLSESAHDLKKMLDAVPLLGLTLDLGHAQLLTEENTSHACLQMFPERIRHMHIHDNRGGSSARDDLHLPVGQGRIAFADIFQKIRCSGYWGTMTLELRPSGIKACLAHVKRLLEEAGLM